MPVYEYRALDVREKNLKGIIDSESVFAARQRLRETNIFPVDLKERSIEEKNKVPTGRSISDLFKRVSLTEDAAFRLINPQNGCGTLQPYARHAPGERRPNANRPLHSQKCLNNRLIADSIAEASRDVEEGQNLSATLSRNKLFPPIVTQMISAGEQSGTLEKMLYKVSDSLETEVESNITLDPLNEYGFLCFSIPGKFSEMMHSVTFFAGYFTIVILMAAPAHRITIRSIKPSISR